MKNIRYYKENIKRKVLIVEDEFVNQQILGQIISSEYDVIYANNGQEALDILHEVPQEISLVLLDLNMPVMDGFELMSIMNEEEILKRIPIIVLTSEKSAEIKSLQLGAQDFITKPYDMPEIILARVKRSILLAEETEIILRTEKDSLTGLTTKKYFFEYINSYDQHNPNAKMDAIAINIKKFRTINALMGHRFGDRLLISIANSLRKLMEKYEGIVSRVDSDTFYLYITSIDDFEKVIVAALEEASNKVNKEGKVAFKVGVNRVVDRDLSVEKRFDDALRAMRLSKDNLETTIVVYDQKMHEDELFNEKLILGFEKSLANKEFKIYLQPKMSILGDKPRLSSAEVLVRWFHPEYGLISPALFVPLFENNGLITQLDKFIWNEAAAQIREWKDKYNIVMPLSINVSRVDLFNATLIEDLMEIMETHQLSFDELYLEVTESALVDDAKEVTRRVRALKDKGFIIEMDDFGTGYSSLHMVSSLPLDALKVDRSFIFNISTNEKSKILVSIIVEITKLLNAKCIAEGVETEEQLNILKEMGVELIQGFYFSPAIPCDAFFDKYLKEKL